MTYKFIILFTFSALFSFVNADSVRTHEKGDIKLFKRLFEVDESDLSYGYISVSIKEDVLTEFKKNECKVFAKMSYVLNKATSFSMHLDNLDPDVLTQQKFNVDKANEKSVITVLYGNNEGSCAMDREMVKRHGYFFYVSDILDEFNFEARYEEFTIKK